MAEIITQNCFNIKKKKLCGITHNVLSIPFYLFGGFVLGVNFPFNGGTFNIFFSTLI